MFENIGGKIKTLAKIVCWGGIILSFIVGSTLMVIAPKGSTELSGLLVMVAGGIGCWVGSFFTYGFGELIDKTSRIAEHLTASPEAEAENTKNEEHAENE